MYYLSTFDANNIKLIDRQPFDDYEQTMEFVVREIVSIDAGHDEVHSHIERSQGHVTRRRIASWQLYVHNVHIETPYKGTWKGQHRGVLIEDQVTMEHSSRLRMLQAAHADLAQPRYISGEDGENIEKLLSAARQA